MDDELITMSHPEIEGTATATRRALDDVWAPRGWVEVEPPVALASDALNTEVTSLGALTKAQLEEVASSAGLDTSSTRTKADLVALIEAAAPAAPTP